MSAATPFALLLGVLLALLLISGLAACSDNAAVGREDSQGFVNVLTNTDTTGTEISAETVFTDRCAACHADPDNKRAPALEAMARLSAARISFAMLNGNMKSHAEGLTSAAIFELAAHISDSGEPYSPAESTFCTERSINTRAVIQRWGMDANNTAYLGADITSISAANVDRLELAWVFGLPETSDARSQPVLTKDTLFVAATGGHLFALDRRSGCIKWHRTLPAPPRTSLTMGTLTGFRKVLFFGDMEAHTVAVDVTNGEIVWRVDSAVSEHSMLTGAPIQHANYLIVPVSLYEVFLAADPEYECCISHGAVLALDANTGQRLWTTDMTEPATPREVSRVGTQNWGPSGVPVWSTPTVDGKRHRIYVGTGQNASQPATDLSDSVVALDLATGEIVWHFQAIAGDAYNGACDQRPPGPNCPRWSGPDHDIGAAVIITQNSNGEDILLAGQKSGDVYALDPDDDGRMIWQEKVGAGSALGGVHWGLASHAEGVFVPISDPAFPRPGYRPRPGLYALDVDDGDELWSSRLERDCETNVFEYFDRDQVYPDCPFYIGLSAAPVVVNDLVFAPSLDGRLRAFAVTDGRQLWSFQTARPFETVNGVEGHGGSIDVAGAIAVSDMIYVQSGYSVFSELPGNLLLAFRVLPVGIQPES